MNKKNIIIGVMGGGDASPEVVVAARRLGGLIAEKGWILLNGGRNSGVMAASAQGAHEKGGLTVGILPGDSLENVSKHIDVPIITGMGHARNCINVLSSDIVVACPGGAGTVSEIALAVKNGKPVVLIGYPPTGLIETLATSDLLHHAESPESAVKIITDLMSKPL